VGCFLAAAAVAAAAAAAAAAVGYAAPLLVGVAVRQESVFEPLKHAVPSWRC